MDIKETLNAITSHIRMAKETWVETNPEHPDMAMYAQLFIDGFPEIVFVGHDKMKMFDALLIGVEAFSPDAISLTTESWGVTGKTEETKINPDTGQRWAQGDLQAYVEKHGKNNGLVGEGLTSVIVNNKGDLAFGQQIFHYENGKVVWDVPELPDTFKFDLLENGEKPSMKGFVPDSLRKIAVQPGIMERFQRERPEDFEKVVAEYGEEVLLGMQKRIALEVIEARELIDAAMVVAPNKERTEYYRKYIGEPS